MSQSEVELCRVIIDEFFGSVAAAIIRVLLANGRLGVPQIAQLTGFSYKSIKEALVAMMQHHLILFAVLHENGRDISYYEADSREIQYLLRAGREVWLTSVKVSQEAAGIVKYVSINGRVRIKDILTAFADSKSSAKQIRFFKSTLSTLMTEAFLRIDLPYHMKPIADLRNELRIEEQIKLGNLKLAEAKLKKELDDLVNKRLNEMESETRNLLKRKAEDWIGKSSKKRKTDDDDDDLESQLDLNENLFIRVNHDKFNVLSRNIRLVELAEERFGKSVSQVYDHMLNILASGSASKNLQEIEMTVTTMALSRSFPRDIDLGSTFYVDPAGRKSKTNSKSSSRIKLEPTRINGENNIAERADDKDDDEEDEDDEEYEEYDLDQGSVTNDKSKASTNDRLPNLVKHLETLASDSLRFLRKKGNRGSGEWTIDWTDLNERVKQFEYERVVKEKYDYLGLRLLRAIIRKGKVDEKQLAAFVLLKQQDIRAVLTCLHSFGALELQEIPRTADRAPSRTSFLWFHRPGRARALFENDIRKAIARHLMRIQSERVEHSLLLQKTERVDVRQNEDTKLSDFERRALARIRMREEKLLTQVKRMEDLLLIFQI
ncbi:DNA-directed RNA polymerase III subunit rpc3 [Neolecta irregularis DAH-3]|uniref:DNA-directed RNA polymerase III subunit RPC3 n=1 Tax=Neolecta irregularis (strain DAH-3) TaxID=1198029 RepID=A0A1U7LN06_NEOID|nr:DNA-directed RNA polymerase III subunit rpc3 [Neolecta irregularis DAH-3]|eukprot:OLL24008.1 DNA-directed RNA polymerase III subunit rpc3 [Neolecta irregularis DAH-3]